MNHYHYLCPQSGIVVRVTSRRQPSPKTAPKRGTWVALDYIEGGWHMSCCPEITWGTLSELTFLGKIKAEDAVQGIEIK